MRADGRKPDELRRITIIPNFSLFAEGSALITCGNTQVLCNVTVEESIPNWLQDQGKNSGWVTAEYAMLPRATKKRSPRETDGLKGRTQEIRRLIGRCLRQAVDLQKLGQRTLLVDCDVIQADGGTRTISITGGYVALVLALQNLIKKGIIPPDTVTGNVAAVSVGLLHNELLLDPCYSEDSIADLDANIVKNKQNQYIEIQVSAEKATYFSSDLQRLLSLADKGIEQLFKVQDSILIDTTSVEY